MEKVFKMLEDDVDEADFVKKMKPKISMKMMMVKKPGMEEEEEESYDGMDDDLRKYFEVADNDEDDLTTEEVSGRMNEDAMVDHDPYYDGDEDDEMLKRIREKMKMKKQMA